MFGTMETGSNYYSDYGSGTSSVSSTTWPHNDVWTPPQSSPPSVAVDTPAAQKTSSYQDLMMGKCTLEDIMKEFQMNGLDSPYSPADDNTWNHHAARLAGLGPGGAYLRQKSWPAPERSPATPLTRPKSHWIPSTTALEFNPVEFTTSTPVEEVLSINQPKASATYLRGQGASPILSQSQLSEEQLRVLNSLPNAVLFSLLSELEQNKRVDENKRAKRMECRFCKNNGERESYYRTHSLKSPQGTVACPVLRAFRCTRCGATGDHAHTIKYCPLSTADDRMKSAAMMRSVRLASGRRRHSAAHSDSYVVFGDTTPSLISDTNVYNSYANTVPLDPSWAALEQKLSALKLLK